MKKFASALALAAFVAPSAHALDFQVADDTLLTIYGNIQVAYSTVETRTPNGDVESTDDFFDNGSTIGFGVETEFDNGLTGFMKLEEDGFDAVDGGVTDNVTDEAFLGVKGDFGAVQFGRDDSLYDDTIGDYWDYQEVFVPTSPGNENTERGLKYLSPDFGGFSFGVESSFTSDAEQANGLDDDFDVNRDANGDDAQFASLAASATYEISDFVVEAAVDQRSNAVVEDENGNNNYLDNPVYGIVASYQPEGLFAVDLGYQRDDREDDEGGSIDVISLGGRLNYGMGDVYGVYQNVKYDQEQEGGEDTFNELALGVNYDVGANMYVYVESVMLDREEDEGDSISTGAIYYF